MTWHSSIPDATRDGEDSVRRLLVPGTDSEMTTPTRALRRGAACGLETRASIDVVLQARRISIKLRIKKKKAKQKAAVEPAASGALTFVVVVVIFNNIEEH